MNQKQINEYFKSEKKRLKAKRQVNVKDYREFFKAPVGETHMTIKYQVPRNIETKYGARKIFRIIVDKTAYDFTVNEKSPLYRDLIHSLADAKGDVEIVLVRTGNGKSTRYNVKEA